MDLSQPGTYTIILDPFQKNGSDVISPSEYKDTSIPASASPQSRISSPSAAPVPPKIVQMQKLYRYDGASFFQKCRNFYRQGKFMEDYEDDFSWTGSYKQYFSTYHDLTVPQLRSYFTWRTYVRKGIYYPISTSFAYMYLYELLCGIGTSSPEDSLQKMKEFEKEFLDSGVGDKRMRTNLHRWMFEYAILHDMPLETVKKLANAVTLKRDQALSILKAPESHTDEEIFSSLAAFEPKQLKQSAVIKKNKEKGIHLFAAAWRYTSEQYKKKGKVFFTLLFGKPRLFRWFPLENAVYWEPHTHADADVQLDACRRYICRGGIWNEEKYVRLFTADPDALSCFLREADRNFRLYLKTGYYLKPRPAGAWATPYITAVIRQDQQEEIEAKRPKITIHFSSLSQIRADAALTRDRLLTEEEKEDLSVSAAASIPAPDSLSRAPAVPPEDAAPTRPDANGGDQRKCTLEIPASQSDEITLILQKLLQGEPLGPYMKEHHLLPSVVADKINEAFWDEIGDSIISCDGEHITLVEDYIDDIKALIGGSGR